MGMFDEIIVPKSYLRDVLDKKDESLFDTNHKFQTKDLENALVTYKIYRKQLYRAITKGMFADTTANKKLVWEKVLESKIVSFYDTFQKRSSDSTGNNDHDDWGEFEGDEYWFEFEFSFVEGKLDTKKLIDKTVTDEETRKATQLMWDIEQEIFDEYRERLSYRFWSKVERVCQRLTNMARNKHSIPYNIRKQAYEASGRLAEDPDALKWYLKTDCDRDI